MKIKRIISQNRRDFWADYECEHCGYIDEIQTGYDDSNFHQNVIPKMKCKKCDKQAPEDHRPLAPKYNEDQQV